MAEEEPSQEANLHPITSEGFQSTDYPQDSQSLTCRTHLKSLVEDEVYTTLHRHFLMEGKGRRPHLPHIEGLTNGLLLQLFFLKEEANASYKELRTWLEKLLPTIDVTESRIYHRVNSILSQCNQLPKDDLQTFLQAVYNFNPLPQALISLGIDNLDSALYNKNPINNISNDVVIALQHSKENTSPIFVRKWLIKLSLECAQLSDSRLRTCISNALREYKKLRKGKKNDDLAVFLKSPFRVVTNESKCQQSEKEIICASSAPEVEISKCNKGIWVSLKCLGCEMKDNEINEKDTLIRDLKEKIGILEREKILSKKRESHLQARFDEVCQSQLYYKRNVSLKKLNEDLHTKISQLESTLENTNSLIAQNDRKYQGLKRKLKSEQTLKSNYKIAKNDLQVKNDQVMYALNAVQEVTPLKENHHNLYSNHIRQLYIALQGEANVASTKATKAVMLVSKHLFNKEFSEKELPCPKTCLNFMDEAHHIAKQQVVEKMVSCQHYTYASDGTGREKQHFMEHHIVLDNGSTLSLGYSEVPNDTADTLLQKSLDLFDELTDVHCDVDANADRDEIFALILSKLRCLMSDRAANMKLFNKKLLEFKKDLIGQDATIEFLHCNAHFLIALSDATEKSAKTVEQPLGHLGRDKDGPFNRFLSSEETAACRIIRLTANVLGPRGDEKNGCRQEWLAYCDNAGIKSTFTSYRSNRFNNLFENANAVLTHKAETLHFLEECVSHNNQLLRSICLDHHDVKLVSVVVGVALFAT